MGTTVSYIRTQILCNTCHTHTSTHTYIHIQTHTHTHTHTHRIIFFIFWTVIYLAIGYHPSRHWERGSAHWSTLGRHPSRSWYSSRSAHHTCLWRTRQVQTTYQNRHTYIHTYRHTFTTKRRDTGKSNEQFPTQ